MVETRATINWGTADLELVLVMKSQLEGRLGTPLAVS